MADTILNLTGLVLLLVVVTVVVWRTIGRTMLQIAELAAETPVGGPLRIPVNDDHSRTPFVLTGVVVGGGDVLLAFEARPTYSSSSTSPTVEVHTGHLVLGDITHDRRAIRLLHQWHHHQTALELAELNDHRTQVIFDPTTRRCVIIELNTVGNTRNDRRPRT